jgi:hypothetical protein
VEAPGGSVKGPEGPFDRVPPVLTKLGHTPSFAPGWSGPVSDIGRFVGASQGRLPDRKPAFSRTQDVAETADRPAPWAVVVGIPYLAGANPSCWRVPSWSL